ncbi:hypothetical protein GCM10010317_021540 [Streptomyces mirabilis]|nr:hypothetical protein GCM10010317_021540 [Streptomyces mirabilis]
MIRTVGVPSPFPDATAVPDLPPPLQAGTASARAAQTALASKDVVTGFITGLLCERVGGDMRARRGRYPPECSCSRPGAAQVAGTWAAP